MRLPMEIRERTLDLMIDNVFKTPFVMPAFKSPACGCPRFDRDHVYQSPQMKTLPTLMGIALNHEFFRIFFRKKKFRFRCCCELNKHLKNNAQFRENIRHIVVHWCGLDSAETFTNLASCPRLETLWLNISKSTLLNLNERANLMRSYFPLSFRNVRICDVLGLDELLEVRGLQEVRVVHIQPKSNSHSVEMDRACLLELLSNKLTLPRMVRYKSHGHHT